MPRSYGQLCGLALALDVIGDRWSLLIVRELLVRDGARYTDLRDGLAGVATNLLADRLRELEAAGVIRREGPQPPVATPLFRLTHLGRGLRLAVEALAVWGGAQVPATSGGEQFRSRWLLIPLEAMLRDAAPGQAPMRIVLRTGDEPVAVEIGGGTVRAWVGEVADPDLLIEGPPKAVLGVISGNLAVPVAESVGVRFEGSVEVLARAGVG